MDRKKYNGYKATSQLDMVQVVREYHYRACQVPEAYQNMVDEIITAQIQALALALGNLELCYLRTKQQKQFSPI